MGEESPFVTREEWEEHIKMNYRVAHGIWPHHRAKYGYSMAKIDSFFEGEDDGKKQVDWARITSKPSTYPPSVHSHDYGTW